MTHTLNRTGLSENRPGEEIVFLAMVQRAQRGQKIEAMGEIINTVLKYKPLNILGRPGGLADERIRQVMPRAGIVTAVFNDLETVRRLVAELKEKKPGISVVLSGLFPDVRCICEEAGLREHTHNISLGVFGRTDRLPDEKTREITTQCGHALISRHYVDSVLKKIGRGKMTAEEGAAILVKPCVCGIGNPERIARLLEAMVRSQEKECRASPRPDQSR
jgi:hypothetical protein